MTHAQKIKLEQSRNREEISQLLGKPDKAEEDHNRLEELTRRMESLEVEYRAAIVAEPEAAETVIDGETRELDNLLSNADLGNILKAALSQRSTDGPEKEIQDHFGLASNQFPIDMLETRAVTPAPNDVGRRQHSIIPQVFPDSVAGHLGISQPTVNVGEQTYTVLTTGATVHTPDKGANVDETTGGFTAFNIGPSRAQASFFWNIEDQARLAGMDTSLRGNLRDALSSKLDDILLNDTDTGLLGGGVTQAEDPTAVAKWTDYKAAITGRVDGLYASMPSGVKAIIGPQTYRHAESVYRGTTTDNESGYEVMGRLSGGVRVSSHIPAAASHIQKAITARATGLTHAVMPIWKGVTFITDNITKAKSGQIVLTALMLYGLKVVRADGFKPLKFKVA